MAKRTRKALQVRWRVQALLVLPTRQKTIAVVREAREALLELIGGPRQVSPPVVLALSFCSRAVFVQLDEPNAARS